MKLLEQRTQQGKVIMTSDQYGELGLGWDAERIKQNGWRWEEVLYPKRGKTNETALMKSVHRCKW